MMGLSMFGSTNISKNARRRNRKNRNASKIQIKLPLWGQVFDPAVVRAYKKLKKGYHKEIKIEDEFEDYFYYQHDKVRYYSITTLGRARE